MTRFWDQRQSVFTESQKGLQALDERLTQNLLWKRQVLMSRTAQHTKYESAVTFDRRYAGHDSGSEDGGEQGREDDGAKRRGRSGTRPHGGTR
ncbi:unnamed protein product, partial [Amoebophrya sp. A25]|eukprot:GSA25T00021052001.1